LTAAYLYAVIHFEYVGLTSLVESELMPIRRDHECKFDILSALKGEDSHGTAPLDWDVQGL